MPEEALTHIASLQVRLLRSESRSRIKYQISTNNIIVLNLDFHLSNKYDLVDKL